MEKKCAFRVQKENIGKKIELTLNLLKKIEGSKKLGT